MMRWHAIHADEWGRIPLSDLCHSLFLPIFTQWISAAAPHLNGCPSFFPPRVYVTDHESSLCALSVEPPPLIPSSPSSIVSCLLHLFYLGKRGFGCDGGSTGEVVVVVAMVVAAGRRRWREGLLVGPHSCAAVEAGGEWGWRAERDHHCIAGHHEWSIVRWLALSTSLCHNFRTKCDAKI